MAQSYSPYFPQNTVNAYTVNGIKFNSTTTNFETNNDLYLSSDKASVRATNIGCQGYRSVIANSVGQAQYAPCSNYTDYQEIMKQMEVTTTTFCSDKPF